MAMKVLFLAATVCATSLALADDPPEGHSTHGEAFNEGPRQAAVLMGGTGNVKFPITTKSAAAQKFFEQGVGQLHGFWFFEAERSFRQVLTLETNCPMAYWGIAMANFNNRTRAVQFIQRASDYRQAAGKREQMYIDGLHKFHSGDDRTKAVKERDYIRSLEAIVQQHPEDIEAKAFLARFIWEYRKNNPISSHQAVDALLDQVFAAAPMHPSHHFRIHLWNSEKDSRALESAARCGQSAPAIAHMWHMPGHTYSKLLRYADAAWQQEASARVDHAHMMNYWVLPDQIHNYAHNNEWLIRNMNNVGRVRDAVALAKNMIELPRHPKWNTFDKKSSSASHGRTRLIETLLRWELWDEMIALSGTDYLDVTTTNPAVETARLRALGVAQFHKGNVDELNRCLNELEAMASEIPPEKKEAAETGADEGDYPKPTPFNLVTVTNAVKELQALLAISDNAKLDAWRLLEEAKDTPKERLAAYYLRIDSADKAVKTAEAGVKAAGKETQPLARYVEVLHAAGKTEEATKQFKALQKISGELDLNAPIFARLTALAEPLGISRDWKAPSAPAKDTGVRPALATLGPVHWTPPVAPEWSLPGENGSTVSLKDFRGRPVIVMFYLGAKCLHCVEQLNAFAPRAKDFADAGIALVAINAGSVADIAKTHEKSLHGGRFPFPIASDESLKTFKQWRCHDDFEQMALHGTFLIDGSGALRWLDISFEPFMNAEFLLRESQRLLGLEKPVQTAGR